MGTTARRHHFLPKFYLAGFTKTAQPDGRLFALDRKDRRTWWATPNDVGLEKHLYSIEMADGTRADEMETELSRAESQSAPVLANVIAKEKLPVGPRGMARLLRFVALSAFRTPADQAQISKMATDFAKRHMYEKLQDGSFDSNLEERHLAEEFVTKDMMWVEPSQNLWLDLMARSINEIGPKLAFRQWDLLIAKPGAPDFVCTDRPVAIDIRKPEEFQEGFIPGISTPHTWMIFPLNCRIVLVGSFDGHHPKRKADPACVALINGILIRHCERFVYSSSEKIDWRGIGATILGTKELLDRDWMRH